MYFDDFSITQTTFEDWKFPIKDHLGSTKLFMDGASGQIVRAFDYAAFGDVMRTKGSEQIDYQYTGQEYDEEAEIHNYRARLYDSELGRFYGVDPQGQFHSPYTGMGNNPVMMVDPDGEIAFLALLAKVGTLAAKGAGMAAIGHTASVGFSEGGFDNWDWKAFGKSLAIGAVSGVATAGIGEVFGPVVNKAGSINFGKEIVRAGAHGVSNTGINTAFGNDVNPWTFGISAVSSLTGSALEPWGKGAQMVGSVLVGGGASELSGGDFWRGAATAATVTGLNHLGKHFSNGGGNEKSKTNNNETANLSLGTRIAIWEFKLRLKWTHSKAAEVLRDADKYADEAARLGHRINPASSAVEAGKILIDGTDFKGVRQVGGWRRVVKTTLDVVTVGGLGPGVIGAFGDIFTGFSIFDGIYSEVKNGPHR